MPNGLSGVFSIAAGSTYNVALVATSILPIVATQPTSRSVQAGSPTTFNVVVDGQSPFSYQWRKNGANIPGATSSALTLNSVSTADAGGYSVTVWNSAGTVSSSVAQLTVSSPLIFTTTFQVPTTAESTPAVIFPTSSSQLKVYVAPNFVANAPVDPNRITVVLTHGWNSNPNEWAKALAASIVSQSAVPLNIVAWDWTEAASASFPCSPLSITGNDLRAAAQRTPEQGYALGRALTNALSTVFGLEYAQPIHFIGHSLGTIVNANAADFLYTRDFASAKTHMTLFDEAEAATGLNCAGAVGAYLGLWDPLSPRPYYYHPLPNQSVAWIDNYVSFAGLLHPEARNVILTNGLPANGSGWIDAATQFHGYPHEWYGLTVPNHSAPMGYRWSFEEGGFAGAPAAGTVYLQSVSELNLVPISYTAGVNLLDERIKKYRAAIDAALNTTAVQTAKRSGSVIGFSLATGSFNAWDVIVNLVTSVGGGSPLKNRLQSGGGTSGATGTNTPSYTWIALPVPSNAVTMSFDFMLQGDGKDDSFAAAVNGTNILSIQTIFIQTNVTQNTGLIDVSPWAGQQVELFLGIVGGTSANASLTVSGVRFHSEAPPSVQARTAGNKFIITWPISAQNYTLETTTAFGTNSWTTVTNLPAIVDLQNTVTNSMPVSSKFYRLRKP